jgi:putative ABC transport system substrate-binding protein
LSRPGGNVTGFSTQVTDLAGKRLELLREIIPSLSRLAIMANVAYPAALIEMNQAEEAARRFGIEPIRSEVRQPEQVVGAFDAFKERAGGLYVCADPTVNTSRVRINTLALAARLPTMLPFRDFVQAGGLVSYGPSFADLFRRTADYVDKILKGAKPADMPVQQPTKFDLVVNLTTAKALGVKISDSFLLRADEVIE